MIRTDGKNGFTKKRTEEANNFFRTLCILMRNI